MATQAASFRLWFLHGIGFFMEYKHVYDLLTSGCNFWTSVMVEQAELLNEGKQNYCFYYIIHTDMYITHIATFIT